jgi:hypothetical protein
MQDDVEEGTVHVQLPVVVNDAWFVELIHGETDVEAHGAATDHMRLLNRPAMIRSDSHSTRPFSRTRGVSKGYSLGSEKTTCAAARLSVCGLRRSTPKISARMGSFKSGTMPWVVELY